ncbi:MAG: STAS domain-containing protein [Acidimicrobiales bacterium]|nr:STAS domain-containing protein [Acidimicrobiales bacterium]
MTDETITITTKRNGATTLIVLTGELDMHTSAHLSSALESALTTGGSESTDEIFIDARGLTFTDSAGLRVLLVARETAEADGVRLRLTHVSDHLDRLLEMTGLREILGVAVT